MIRAVVLDVDGVVVGSEKGNNFPHPGPRVAEALKKMNTNGIHISFLTGKSSHTLIKMVKRLGIDGLHVGDSGAMVSNPVKGTVVYASHVPFEPLMKLLTALEEGNIQTFIFSENAYYSLRKYQSPFTEMYARVIDLEPHVIDSYSDLSDHDILKVNAIAHNEHDKKVFATIMAQFPSLEIHASPWSQHPALGDARFSMLTKAGISKYSGFKHLVDNLHIDLSEVLGVGDTIHDWEFIEHCGYKGVMANATDELKGKADFNDPHTFLGGHVDEDGVLNIFKHFNLI
jgi:HAD superfamily hydrolase (TIGR01484 family)